MMKNIATLLSGSARVSRSAGTGKTIVALHRAVHLACSNPHARVLLATLSDKLCPSLTANLRCLTSDEPRIAEQIEVHALDGLAQRLYGLKFGPVEMASPDLIKELIREAANAAEGDRFTHHFLWTEWEQVVDARQIQIWKGYRDVPRLGPRACLPGKQLASLWSVFEKVRSQLAQRKLVTQSQVFTRLADHFAAVGRAPFDFAVLDESQDVSIAQLRFLAALGAGEGNRLFFAGDLAKRSFQPSFSWESFGLDVRTPSHSSKIN